jgi:hypothetical protein
MERIGISETSVSDYKIARCHKVENLNLNNDGGENLKACISWYVFTSVGIGMGWAAGV